MSHIAATNQRSRFFSKSSFVVLSLAAPVFVAAIVFEDDIAKAMKEIGKEKSASGSAVAASRAEAARPKDYTELSLDGDRMRVYRFELKSANRNTGPLVLDERATNFDITTAPGVGWDFIEHPSGRRTYLPPGDHPRDPFGLWGKMNQGGRKQLFSIEAKGDCAVTFTVSAR